MFKFANLWNWPRPHGENQEGPESELTFLSVSLGLLIGCLLCFTNMYFGLQTGWISMMSLQSALLGYLLSRLASFQLSPQENVVIQTTATAMGTMPLAAGFVGIIPALSMLDPELDGSPPWRMSWLGAVGWSTAVAFFGVFLSPPLRKQVIIEEQLNFPSGTATAQMISVLHKEPLRPSGREFYHALPQADTLSRDEPETSPDRHNITRHTSWLLLGWSFLLSSVMTLFAYFFPALFAIPLLGQQLAEQWLWTFTPSLSYVGQGIIMGFPTTLSMNLGMLVGWAVLSPLSKIKGWAPGPVGDMATGARGWILWISLAVMLSDSIVSLIPTLRSFLFLLYRVTVGNKNPPSATSDPDVESNDRLVPRSWVLYGSAFSIVGGATLVWLIFGKSGLKVWSTLVAFALGALLSLLGVRALGETDLNPVSGLGKISQLIFAIIQPGNTVANLLAGGIAEAGAQQAGDLMQDLKTGHLLHASPRALFIAQLIGSLLSIFVTTTVYNLYTRTYPIPGPAFPAPTAHVWLGLARLLRSGQLPPQAANFMLSFSLVFSLNAFARTYSRSNFVKWLPSGIAFAIGFLNTPSFSIARLVGGFTEYLYRKRHPNQGVCLIIVASGFVLGEGVASVIALVLRTLSVEVASCWGCVKGLCAGCA